jgi:cell wall-associated NlpC family hydrolase
VTTVQNTSTISTTVLNSTSSISSVVESKNYISETKATPSNKEDRLPKGIDGSYFVIDGIRKAINPDFKTCTADQLFKLYSIPTEELERGNVIFFDYENDGTIDYATTYLGNGNMIFASSSGAIGELKPFDYLDGEIRSRSGKIHYGQLDWQKISEAK